MKTEPKRVKRTQNIDDDERYEEDLKKEFYRDFWQLMSEYNTDYNYSEEE